MKILFSLFIFMALAYFGVCLPTTTPETNNTEISFNDSVKNLKIANHFESLTVNHPLYTEIANGTLPLPIFKHLIQQDELYVNCNLKSFGIMEEREMNSTLKEELHYFGSQDYTSYFDVYFNKFNFSRAVHMLPASLDYCGAQTIGAKYEYLGVALATIYPCFLVWAKMGENMAKIANLTANSTNPYKEFIEALTPSDYLKTDEIRFTNLINAYYDQLGNDTATKRRMMEAYIRSVEYEFNFAESNYKIGEPESIPPPEFSDLVEYVSPDLQNALVNHKLYVEIGKGTLTFSKFRTLIQQDHIYVSSFYKALDILGERENDPYIRINLTENAENYNKWFKKFYDEFGFAPTNVSLPATKEYTDYMQNRAKYGTIPEGISSLYPCYFIWSKFGSNVAAIANETKSLTNMSNPYEEFIKIIDPTPNDYKSLKKINKLINAYFNNISASGDIEGQVRMFEAVRMSIYYELLFADNIYQNGGNALTHTPYLYSIGEDQLYGDQKMYVESHTNSKILIE